MSTLQKKMKYAADKDEGCQIICAGRRARCTPYLRAAHVTTPSHPMVHSMAKLINEPLRKMHLPAYRVKLDVEQCRGKSSTRCFK